jgi:STE24 endopeptidase
MGLAALGALSFGWPGDRLFALIDGLAWWAQALSFPGLVIGVVALLRLRIAFWRGYVHEHRWGLSTQSVAGWAADRAKGLAVGVVLGTGVLSGLVALARTLPEEWPLVAAPAGVAWVALLSFMAPVVLEPVFNRFRPLPDRALAADIRALSERAGVPVREVLVADASRRTRKANAYVSGLGRTRRVVLFDTLLARATPAEIRLVAAHELGHRRRRHELKGTALAAAGAVVAVTVLWLALRSNGLLGAIGARGAGDPRVIPFVLLTGTVLQLLAFPLGTALSRRWERTADRIALELTADVEDFVSAHVALARSNLSDLAPPRLLYVLLFTHPTPPQRIAAARRWAARASAPAIRD